MSRESLLDDAIAEAKRDEDWQLAEWLRMARGSEDAARWYTERLQAYESQCALLADENAKLRKLVRVMAYCMQDDNDCDRCAMNGASMRLCIDPYFACYGLYDKLCKLGIEVD